MATEFYKDDYRSKGGTMRIIFAEFLNGRPQEVYVEDGDRFEGYDFEWSKYHQTDMYQGTSSMPRQKLIVSTDCFWAADDIEVDACGAKRLKRFPKGYRRETLFDDTMESEEFWIWCSICDDMITCDDPCEHVWWCEECAMWCSHDEHCEHKRPEDD